MQGAEGIRSVAFCVCYVAVLVESWQMQGAEGIRAASVAAVLFRR
jgi:hypothetical protein